MAAGNAVFTEVLQIGIDTSVFAAQMKQVEQIYANSLKNMPNLGQMGTQLASGAFQKAAQEISQAAQSIETNVITMSGNVQKAMTQMATSAQTAGASTASSVKKAASDVTEHMSVLERVGNAFETAFIRIPARMAAIAALGVVVGAAAAPLKLLADGFKNLAEQTPEFKQVRTQLADTLSVLESVAAKPFFDLVLNAMRSLSQWLTENKHLVEQVAFAFGNLIETGIKPLFDMFNENDGHGNGFLKTVNVVITAIAYAITLAKTLVNLTVDALKLNPTTGLAQGMDYFKDFAKNLKDAKKDLSTGVDEFMKDTMASVHAQEALDGQTNDKTPNPKASSQLQTSSEIMTKYRQDLSDLKLDHKKAMDTIAEQENNQVINRETAKGKIVAAVAEERKAIDSLILKYRALLSTATDINQLDGSTMRQKTDMLLMGGRGSNSSSPYSQGEAETKAAIEAADKERMTAKAKSLADEKSLVEKNYSAEVALDKKSETEKQTTHEAAVRAEMALEEERHQQIIALNAQMPDGARNTPNYLAKQKAQADEEQKHNASTAASKEALAAATREDTAATLAYSNAMAKAQIALLQDNDKQAVALGHKREHIALTKDIIELELQLAKADMAAAKSKLSGDFGPAADIDKAKIAELQAKIKQLENAQHNANESGSALGHEIAGDSQSLGDQLKQSLHLDTAADDFDKANNGLEKFAAGLEGAVGVLQGLAGAVQGAVAAYQKGGAMGAAGSLLSNSSVMSGVGSMVGKLSESAGKMVPLIGPMIGTMFSTITSLFSMGIQKMVTAINDKISKINEQAQLGQITLTQQITELQQEKQDAIDQLGNSKKKGAGAELDKILKSLNSEIAQLQKQQKDIINNFNLMVKSLALGSSVMSDWFQTWTQINQQVKQYVDAGGSLVTAAQFLNDQLQLQRQKLQDQLNSGNETAIQDSIQLNQLLTQRVQMMKDEAATEFGMLNADSMERRTSNAVKLGTELQKQRATFAQQLSDTNNQISLEQQKVSAESKIFDINKSIAQLQKDSNALTIASLNEQLAKYTDMAKLLAATRGMVFDPNKISTSAGAVFGIPGEPSVTISGGVTITVSANGTTGGQINRIGNPVFDSLIDSINRQIRSGTSPT